MLIGRGPHAEVEVDDLDVAPRHARLLVRRGRVVLAGFDAPIERRGHPIHAPVVLEPDEPFSISKVQLSAKIVDDDAFIGASVGGFQLGREISVDPDHRRFVALAPDVPHAELVTPSSDIGEWWRVWAEAPTSPGGQIPEIIARGAALDATHAIPWLIERLEPGLRLSEVLAAARAGKVTLPVELALVTLAQTAEAAALDPRGHHGAIEPAMIHLGDTGAVWLVRPGPRPDGYGDVRRRAFLSTERRFGLPPTSLDDVFALGVLARAFLEAAPHELLERLSTALTAPRESRATLDAVRAELLELANRGPFDPSRTHVSRVVRLLVGDSKPIVHVRKSA